MKLKQYFYAILFLYNFSSIAQTQIIKEISALDFGKLHPHAQILQCTKDYPFDFKPYPLYPELADEKYPHQGVFQDTYILSVPNATAHFCNYNLWGINGLIFINNYFIKECQIKNISPFHLQQTNTINVQQAAAHYQLKGSLAICSHIYPDCYGHFILDVLCQLALLEVFNINYDYLCIPYHTTFMQEALELWGIDKKKIIPLIFNRAITADTIILPTSVTQTKDCVFGANYSIDFLIQHVKDKLLKGAQKLKQNNVTHSKKIFISRKDAPYNKRSVPNEDEIFDIFKNYNFQRYELTKLSLAEQILLFHNAKEIASFVGSGSLNIMFSQPGTKYLEIVQSMIDATFFFLADIFNITYKNINDTTKEDVLNSHPFAQARAIDTQIIKNYFNN